MNETQTTDFSDFFEAFDGSGASEQSGTENSEAPQEAAGEPVSEDNSSGTNEQENENLPADDSQQPDSSDSKGPNEQMFELKVNKETRRVTLEQLRDLAQKGADYDRVKEKAQDSDRVKAENQELVKFRDENKPVLDTIARLASEAKVTPADFVRKLRMNLLKAGGMSEEAAVERVGREDAEAEANRLRSAAESADVSKSKAARDLEEFRQKYPGVTFTKEDLDALSPDFQNGMSLTEAYQKRQAEALEKENRSLSQQLAELKEKLAAADKNARNRSNTPGSAKDSGQKKTTQFDDFWEAFGK